MFAALPEALEVVAVPVPGVVQGVVGVGHRGGEGERAERPAQLVGSFDEGRHGGQIAGAGGDVESGC